MTIFDRDKWQEVWVTLSRNKLRTFLTAFGVFWGIFMLVIMMGSGRGLQNGVISEFNGYATNAIYVWTQQTSIPYKGLPAGRRFNFENEDVEAMRNQLSEIDVLAPRNQLGGYGDGNNVTRGINAGAFSVMGDYPAIMKIQPMAMKEGRFINDLDISSKRKVAVIGAKVKDVLFGNEEAIGGSIKIQGVYFMVIGTFGTLKGGEEASEDEEKIYIPFTTFQKAFNFGNRVGWFAMTSRPDVPATEMEVKVKAFLGSRHKVSPEDTRAIGCWNSYENFKKMTGIFIAIEFIVWFVGIGTLLAGIIGVSNIMLIIIKERAREIGIRRAIGATPSSIVSQIISESALLTFVAGYIGLAAGVFALEFISGYTAENGGMLQNPEIELGVALKALFILVVSGILAGIIPALRALRIPPVEALRTE